MAVWSWFIPIIVLFRPVQIMNEIWTETQEKIKKYDSNYILKSGGLIIGLWWTLFIISNFIGRYVLKTAFKKDETIEQLIEGSQAILISDIMQIPEALLVILIVFQLSKMELKLAEEVRKNLVVTLCISNSGLSDKTKDKKYNKGQCKTEKLVRFKSATTHTRDRCKPCPKTSHIYETDIINSDNFNRWIHKWICLSVFLSKFEK